MQTKRNLIQICLLGGVLLALPAVVQAQFTFTTNNGAITITGYTGSGGAVVIPDTTNGYPVTSIRSSTFEYKNLTSVTIPGSITNIGDSAFNNCSSLTNVTLSDGLANIGNYAFQGCFKLAGVTIPNSVTIIGNYAFSSTALTNVVIPANVTIIGGGAFYISSLTNI